MRTENVAIIPARGGSKAVPLKNLRPLNGIPLVAYGVLCALRARSIDRTIVTTDHPEIAQTASEYGAEVILRPAELASDDMPTEPAMQHAVSRIEDDGVAVGNIALIQCTCPFRLAADIDRGFELLAASAGDAVMSVSLVPAHFHPYWQKRVSEHGGYLESIVREEDIDHDILETKRYRRRQDLPGRYYWKNGALYIMSRDSLMVSGHRYGTRCFPLVIENDRICNIDTEDDFRLAEEMLRNGAVTLDFIDQ